MNQLIITQASAGGGKTYTLIDRYINLLKNYPIKSILAITFTNKAADELKIRILTLLKNMALDGDIWAQEKVDYILDNFSDFSIRTIDSFMNCILQTCALDIGINPQNLTLNQDTYIDYVIDTTIDRVTEDESIRRSLLGFLTTFQDILGYGTWYPIGIIKQKIKEFITQENRSTKSYPQVTYTKQKQLQDSLHILQTNLKRLSKKICVNVMENTPCFSFLQGLQKSNNILLKNINAAKIKKFIDETTDAHIKKLLCQLHTQLNHYVDILSHYVMYDYVIFFSIVSKQLQDYKKDNQLIFVEEIAKKIYSFVEKGTEASFFYYKLGEKFLHYLIDEFQDTSQLQWENLYPLIENALSEGGSLYCTGDTKQAIYRWRGGRLELFEYIQHAFPSVNQIKKLYLEYNYRSRQNIVNFINQIFSLSNLKVSFEKLNFNNEYCLNLLENVYNNVYQKIKYDGLQCGGCVDIEFIFAQDKEDLSEKVKAKLHTILVQLLQHYKPNDICILLRRRERVREVVGWLIEWGITVVSEDSLSLDKHPRIVELISLLRFLHSTYDEISFVSFVTSDIFLQATCMDKEQILHFLEKSSEGRREYYWQKFQQYFPQIWHNFIEPIFNAVGYLSLYELLQKIYAIFQVRKNFVADEAFYMELLELVCRLEDKGLSLSTFLQWYDNIGLQLRPSVPLFENIDAVRVMTIHKAKGLEFDAVIVPFTDEKFYKFPNYIYTSSVDGLDVVYLKRNLVDFNPKLKKLADEELAYQIIEQLNLLYVALTRAKKNLSIFVTQTKRTHHCWANFLDLSLSRRGVPF